MKTEPVLSVPGQQAESGLEQGGMGRGLGRGPSSRGAEGRGREGRVGEGSC